MVEAAEEHFTEYAIEEFLVRDEPYYRPVGDEIELFTAAYRQHIPVLLKGPTGAARPGSWSTWPGSWAGLWLWSKNRTKPRD